MQLQRGANTAIGTGAVAVDVNVGGDPSADISAYLLERGRQGPRRP